MPPAFSIPFLLTSLLISVFPPQICGTPVDVTWSTRSFLSAGSANFPLSLNATIPSVNVYCHKSLGEHLTAQLPDCQRVLEVIRTRDIEDVGNYAVFSWDPAIATYSTDNIYIMPQRIVHGNCRATVQLNGVRSVRALWGVGVRDAFGQLMKTCAGKYDTGGFTFAQRTANGLRVTLGRTNGDDEVNGPSNGVVAAEAEPQVLTGGVPTSWGVS